MSDTAIAGKATRTRITPMMWGLRITVLLSAVGVLAQPVWIGLLYTGEVYGVVFHGMGAAFILLSGLVHLVLSILRWKPGGGPAAGIGHSVAFLVLIGVQAVLGVFQLYPLHFPIGVLMAVGSVSTVRETWREGRPAAGEVAA